MLFLNSEFRMSLANF